MSRRSRRRKRGAAAGERAREVDVERPSDAAQPIGRRGVRAPPLPFRYLAVCDVEATCEESGFKGYEHEIIEFPVVVVDLESGEIHDEFHSYVRPTVNTTLSDFCTRLTGITQPQIDTSPALPEVLAQFEEWRVDKGLEYSEEGRNFAFAADGPWDLRYFLHGECSRKGIAKAAYFDKWVNVKQLFADFYQTKTCKIHKMLEKQGMRFEGRLHSGIDDTRNIARIAIRLRQDGAAIYVNEKLPERQRTGGSQRFATGGITQ
jgi:3'-5' exoribonuclease 1